MPNGIYYLYNLRGNVREWTTENNFTFGGGWKDSHDVTMSNMFIYQSETNSWTGFRNVCKMRKWKNLNHDQ